MQVEPTNEQQQARETKQRAERQPGQRDRSPNIIGNAQPDRPLGTKFNFTNYARQPEENKSAAPVTKSVTMA
jgi:hypothetical protein